MDKLAQSVNGLVVDPFLRGQRRADAHRCYTLMRVVAAAAGAAHRSHDLDDAVAALAIGIRRLADARPARDAGLR
jgi:hypothetical protein